MLERQDRRGQKKNEAGKIALSTEEMLMGLEEMKNDPHRTPNEVEEVQREIDRIKGEDIEKVE